MLATAVLPPDLHRWPCSARYLSPTHALHPPKNEAEVRKTAARFSSSCSPSAFGTGLPSYATYPLVSLHDFFHDKHQIPSMCSARRLHAHVHALSTNTSQLVAPHMLNSFGHLIGSPNEDRLRTFHHNLRHGCQKNSLPLHKNKVEPTVLAAVCQMKQKTRMPSTRFRWCKLEFLLSRSMYAHILGTYFLTLCLTFFLTYLLTFFLTYLLTFFLTYLITFFLTYLLTFFLTSF